MPRRAHARIPAPRRAAGREAVSLELLAKFDAEVAAKWERCGVAWNTDDTRTATASAGNTRPRPSLERASHDPPER